MLRRLRELLPEAPIAVWDATEAPFPDQPETTFFVPGYMSSAAALQAIASMPNLEVLQLLTAGVDRFVDALPQGVTLCNARGVHDDATAELAVALLLASVRGLPEFGRAQLEGSWQPAVWATLRDQRVGILGYGAIGRAIEARLLPFGVEVVRGARTPRYHPDVLDFVEFVELVPSLSALIIAVPLTPQTHHLVDARFLARLRDGALVVNVARGPIVDTTALVAELASGRLRAALDVTDPEPLPREHPLWRLPNVLITPHVGGNVRGLEQRALALVARNVRRYVAGEPLINVVTGSY